MEFNGAQQAEVVKLFYVSKSPGYVVKTMKRQYPHLKELNKWKIYRMVQKFEETGSLQDARQGKSGRKKLARNKENIEQIDNIIAETPKLSVRKVLHEVNARNKTTMSKSSVYRVLKYDLDLVPYKISIMQHLKPSDIAYRINFANWAANQTDDVWNHV